MSSQPSRFRSAIVMPRAPAAELTSSRSVLIDCAAIGSAAVIVSSKVPRVRRVNIVFAPPASTADGGVQIDRHGVSASAKNHAGGELVVGVERALHRAHVVEAALAVELAQERLLHGVPADAVLC